MLVRLQVGRRIEDFAIPFAPTSWTGKGGSWPTPTNFLSVCRDGAFRVMLRDVHVLLFDLFSLANRCAAPHLTPPRGRLHGAERRSRPWQSDHL